MTQFSRRRFLAASGAAMASILASEKARAAAARPLRIGLIGGDSDGISLVSRAFRADSDFQLVAIADEWAPRARRALDIFTHPLRRSGPHPQVSVEPDGMHSGADAAEQLCDRSDVDVVFVAGIPAFRPAHVHAAIAAGKHVLMLGPGATDAMGCHHLMAAAQLAEASGLSIGVDLADGGPTRIAPGEIDVRWQRAPWRRTVDGGSAVTNWYFTPELSGGALLTEGFPTIAGLNQLHLGPPLSAEGRLGTGPEDYVVRYLYRDGATASVHFTVGRGLPTLISTRFGESAPLSHLPVAATADMAGFFDRLRMGDAQSWRPRFARFVNSTRTAILGRDAARAGRTLSWSEIA